MTDPDIGRGAFFTFFKALWPFAVWLLNPGNFLIFVSILVALAQLGYTLWKWRREWKRKGAA